MDLCKILNNLQCTQVFTVYIFCCTTLNLPLKCSILVLFIHVRFLQVIFLARQKKVKVIQLMIPVRNICEPYVHKCCLVDLFWKIILPFEIVDSQINITHLITT